MSIQNLFVMARLTQGVIKGVQTLAAGVLLAGLVVAFEGVAVAEQSQFAVPITRTIPIRVIVGTEACNPQRVCRPPEITKRTIHRAVASGNRSFRAMGIQFTTSIEFHSMPTFVDKTNPNMNTLFSWADVREELVGVFPGAYSSAIDPNFHQTARNWLYTVTLVFGDPSEIVVFVIPSGTPTMGKPTGAHPRGASLVFYTDASFNDGNHLFEHELGHYFGLRHSWAVHLDYVPHPIRGTQITAADSWDLIYCLDGGGNPFFFSSRNDVLNNSGICASSLMSIDQAGNCKTGTWVNDSLVPGSNSLMQCNLSGWNYLSFPGKQGIFGMSPYLGNRDNLPLEFRYGINPMGYNTGSEAHPDTPGIFSPSQVEIIKSYATTSYNITEEVILYGLDAFSFEDTQTHREFLGWEDSAWKLMPGEARDIAGGSNGDMWAVGSDVGHWNEATESWDWYSYNKATFHNFRPPMFDGMHIAVAGRDDVWITMRNNRILRKMSRFNLSRKGSPLPPKFVPQPGRAIDIAGGANGAVWILGMSGTPYEWDQSTHSWIAHPGIVGSRIAVAGVDRVWVIQASDNAIYFYNNGGWRARPGTAIDIAGGADGSLWALRLRDGRPYIWDPVLWQWVVTSTTTGDSIGVSGWGTPWSVSMSEEIHALR